MASTSSEIASTPFQQHNTTASLDDEGSVIIESRQLASDAETAALSGDIAYDVSHLTDANERAGIEHVLIEEELEPAPEHEFKPSVNLHPNVTASNNVQKQEAHIDEDVEAGGDESVELVGGADSARRLVGAKSNFKGSIKIEVCAFYVLMHVKQFFSECYTTLEYWRSELQVRILKKF